MIIWIITLLTGIIGLVSFILLIKIGWPKDSGSISSDIKKGADKNIKNYSRKRAIT